MSGVCFVIICSSSLLLYISWESYALWLWHFQGIFTYSFAQGYIVLFYFALHTFVHMCILFGKGVLYLQQVIIGKGTYFVFLHCNLLFCSSLLYLSLSSSLQALLFLFIPRHTIVAGYYGFTLDVRVSVRRSYVRPTVFRFQMITWVNINGFSPNLVCELILWRFDLG